MSASLRRRLPGLGDSRRTLARGVTLVVFAAAGLLMVTSAQESAGTDLRPERYDDLADLARVRAARVTRDRAEVAALTEEVAALSDRTGSRALEDVRRRAPAERRVAGIAPVSGPGLVVTLDDAPDAVLDSAGEQLNEALVHQQDIQAVANALWAGGAEALTIRGVRVVSTTGIKCVGNTVILNGVPYSPPYDLAAVGDPERLRAAVEASPYVQSYLQAREIWQLGWEVEEPEVVRAPAYTGIVRLEHARPIGQASS